MLLQGFDEEDSDTVLRALNSPFIKHMDIEYARLSRELPLPQPTTVAPKATVRENAAPSYVSPNASAQSGTTHSEVCLCLSDLSEKVNSLYIGIYGIYFRFRILGAQ